MDIQLNNVFLLSSTQSSVSAEKENWSDDLKERLMWLRTMIKGFTHSVSNYM